jgi:GntR family transcriptional repressor for pyruvate dehydrogenase complex
VLDSLSLAPARRSSLTDDIVERLVGLILEEGLVPGDKLPSERELMVRLGVGRSSLREAVKTLSALGLVDVRVGSGMFVTSGDASALITPLSWGLLVGERSAREVVEARRVVEIELAGLAAERATDGEIAAIGEKLALMRASLDDADAFARYDLEFHLAVARAAHNQVLYRMIDTLRHVLRAWFVEVFPRRTDKSEPIRKHEPILAAIRARDPGAARAAMAAHLDSGARWLNELIVERAGQGRDRRGGWLSRPGTPAEGASGRSRA